MSSDRSPLAVAGVEMGSMLAVYEAQDLSHLLHYIAPAATLCYYLIATAVSVLTMQNLKIVNQKVPHKLLLLLMASVSVSYMIEATMLLIDTFTKNALWSSTDTNVYALSSVLVWTMLIVGLKENCCIWYPFYGSWLLSFITEAILLALGLTQGGFPNAFCYIQVAIQTSRVLALVLLPTVLSTMTKKLNAEDEESASLLGRDQTSNTTQTSASNSTYGATAVVSDDAEDSGSDEDDYGKKYDKKKNALQERLRAKGNWFTYIRPYSIFIPFLWPSKQPFLKAHLLGVALCLVVKGALNVLEPRQLGILLDHLSTSKTEGSIKPLVLEALLYVIYRWVLSVIGFIRRRLWMPIELNASKQLKVGAYNQIMGLSRDYHTEKQSGELYRSIDQGNAIVDILNISLLQIVPVLVDLVIAILYLYHIFGPYMALMIAGTAIAYFCTSSYYLSRINLANRSSTTLARKESQIMYDSVGGWHTVSYFNRVSYEGDRYAKAVSMVILGLNIGEANSVCAGTSRDSTVSFHSLYYVSGLLEDTAIEIGLAGAAFLAVYQIARGENPIGSFAMLMAYWGNFTGSLYYLLSTQHSLLRNLIDAEALLKLFQEKPTVKDGTRVLQFHRGSVDFHAVKFSYDGKKNTIKNLDFHAGPGDRRETLRENIILQPQSILRRIKADSELLLGQRIALVGETGGGKSTILKLLFRFYDANEGNIEIDGQDVKDMTLESLRGCIGVVPQDPSMFNGTIMDNVRYSRLDATDEEVINACKAAAVHEKISSFTKGYASKVGEGGVKLSGGELQRIAIARVILKDPQIVLLDEATSAVDSETEARIQGALEKLTKGRTTFTVAHRLSTVTNSDIIIVIKDGEIIEKGSPKALLEAKGKYHDLWLRQIGIVNTVEEEKVQDPNPDPDPEHNNDAKLEVKEEEKGAQSGETRRASGDSSTSGTNSLRATAPAFVPRTSPVPHYQRGTVAKGGQPSTSSHQDGPHSANVRVDVKKNEAIQTHKPFAITDGASDADYLTSTSADEARTEPGGTHSLDTIQRQRNNQSESNDSALKTSHANAPSKGLRQQPHRVSAPGNGPASVLRQTEGTHQQRRRRQRHAKNRERLANGSSPSALYPSTPLAPLHTPAEGSLPAVGVIGKGRGNVQFAPDA